MKIKLVEQVTVCVHHINGSGPNLIIIHLEKIKCDCRSGPCKKKSRPGVQTAKDEYENSSPRKRNQKYPIQWGKTKQKRKRDDNRHEPLRTQERGAGRNDVLAMKSDG